jgi:predicted negative regulator of RcsB-dependent stress response
MRCSELEQECAKFKQENQEMRELIASFSDQNSRETGASLLAQQCAQMQLDLDRYREERTNLKTIVLSQESNLRDSRFDSLDYFYLLHSFSNNTLLLLLKAVKVN